VRRADQFALELGEAAEDGQHQSAVRRGGVGPGVAERAKADVLAAEQREDVEQVARRARQPVEPRDSKTSPARSERSRLFSSGNLFWLISSAIAGVVFFILRSTKVHSSEGLVTAAMSFHI
jgi:hypothetical protein